MLPDLTEGDSERKIRLTECLKGKLSADTYFLK